MNDDKFDSTEPIIDDQAYKDQPVLDPTNFEDIGANLTGRTAFSIDSGIGSATPQGIASDDSKLYVRTSGNGGRDIRRFTFTGTYEADGNATLAVPTGRPANTSGSPTSYSGFHYFNGKFYVVALWTSTRSGLTGYSLERYSSSFAWEARLWGFATNQAYVDPKLNSQYMYIRSANQNSIIRATHAFGGSSFFLQNLGTMRTIGLTSDRLFVLTDTGYIAYDFSGTRITSDDETFPARLGTPIGAADNGQDLYVLGDDTTSSNYSIFPYTANVITRTVATAAWSSVSFTGGKLTGTLTFSGANVTGISTGDFEVVNDSDVVQTGWTFDAPSATATAGTGITVSATAPFNLNASFKLRLKATSVRSDGSTTDNAPAAAVASNAVSVNSGPPPPMLTVATATWSSERGGTNLAATLTFSGAAVTNIESSDFEVVHHRLSRDVQTGWRITPVESSVADGGSLRVIAIPPFGTTGPSGPYRIRLKATSVRSDGSTTDNAPAANVDSDARTVDYQRGFTPNAAVDGHWIDEVGGRTLTANIYFEYDVTRFDRTDLEVINSSGIVQTGWTITSTQSASATLNAGIKASFTATPPANTNGSFRLRLKTQSLRSDGYTGPGNNAPINASTSIAVPIDTRPIQVATATWSNTSYTTGKLQGTLTFNVGITGLSSSDFEILDTADASQTGWTFDSIPSTASANTGITIRANPPTNTKASFKIRLKATSVRGPGTITDNSPTANVDFSSAIAVNNQDPPVVATASWSSISYTNGKLTDTLTFNQNVIGISSSDFEILNASGNTQTGWTFGSISATAAANTGITISATPPSNTNGSFRFRLKATSVFGPRAITANSPAAAVTSGSASVDNRPPQVATAQWSNESFTGSKLQATITFNAAVTGISASDFEVLNNSNVRQTTGWTFDTPSTTASANSGIIIRVTPPANTNGLFKIRLKGTSVRGPRATTDNSPAANVNSAAASVDNRAPLVATASWTSISYCTTSGKLEGVLTFNQNVTNINSSDFAVLNTSNVDQNWTFDTPSSTASDSVGITIRAIPPANTIGSFKLRLKANSIRGPRATSNNSPAANTDSATTSINNYSAVWQTPIGPTSDRAFSANITLSEDPAGLFSVTSDFDVEVRSGSPGSYTWATDSAWTLTSSGTGTSRTITATPPNTVSGGTYRITLNQNAFGSGKPSADISTSGIVIPAYVPPPHTATWENPTYTSSTRAISAALTLSEDPGSAFDVDNDFEVQNDSNVAQTTGWTLSSSGTGIRRTITATPDSTVTAGSYKIVLKEDAFGTDKPAAATASRSFTIGGYVDPSTLDDQDQFRVIINVPENSIGAMQVSVKARSFNVHDNADQLGPENQQYLGTIYYNTIKIPEIENLDYDGIAVVGNNDFGVDFNTEVSRFNSDSLQVDGIDNISIVDTDITFAATPADDTIANRPAVADRNTAITQDTRAKYFRVRIVLDQSEVDSLAGRIMTIRTRPDTINND